MPGAVLSVFYPLDPLNCYHAHFVCVLRAVETALTPGDPVNE